MIDSEHKNKWASLSIIIDRVKLFSMSPLKNCYNDENRKQQPVTSTGSFFKSCAWHEVKYDGSTCNHIGRKQILWCLPVGIACIYLRKMKRAQHIKPQNAGTKTLIG